MKTVKRLNSLEEIPLIERKKAAAFGYQIFTWYAVRVVVNKESFKIFYKRIGFSEKMIFDLEDDDLNYGIVGLGTFGTQVAFDNIMLRPLVNEKNYNFQPDDLPTSINPDEDVFFYNTSGNASDECGIEEGEEEGESDSPGGGKGKGKKRKPKKLKKEASIKIWWIYSMG